MKTVKEIENEIKGTFVQKSSWSGTYICDIGDYERFELIEQENWTQDHKDQHRQSIYFDTENNVFIAVNESRTGTYHGGYDSYDEPVIQVVRKVEKEVTRIEVTWETVSSDTSDTSPVPMPAEFIPKG